MKILVVDDEPDVRRVVVLSLERVGGMEVLEAPDADAGLALAEEFRPDAVLLDVMMPIRDGPATLAALQGNTGTAQIPVIFLTARAGATEVARLEALGAAGVLTKPFDPLELPNQIRALLGRTR